MPPRPKRKAKRRRSKKRPERARQRPNARSFLVAALLLGVRYFLLLSITFFIAGFAPKLHAQHDGFALPCFDLVLPSGDYDAPEICTQQDDALANTLPTCLAPKVTVVEGCLGFAPLSANVNELITREGREIVRTLSARDSCSSTWQTRYRLDSNANLVSETFASSRCQNVPLRHASSSAFSKSDFAADAHRELLSLNAKVPDDKKAHARALLARALIEAQPSTCDLFASDALAPFLKRDALKYKLPRCAQEFLERELTTSHAPLAENALLKLLEHTPKERALVLLRAAAIGVAPLGLARSLRDAKDEHAPLKNALFQGAANTYFSRSALALELFEEEAAFRIAEGLSDASCENAQSVLRAFSEVGQELKLSKNTNRTFTPLLRFEKQDSNKSCVRLRTTVAQLLAERLAEGRQSTPAAWRLLLRTLDRDPDLEVRVSLEREVRKHFSCKARANDLMIPGFVLENFQNKGIAFLCAHDPAAALDESESTGENVRPLTYDEADVEIEEPHIVQPQSAVTLSNKSFARHDDFRFGALSGAEVFEEGALLTLGIESIFPLDQTFSVQGGATLSLMCSECLSESVISRRDLRLELGIRYAPIALPVMPYLRVSGRRRAKRFESRS